MAGKEIPEYIIQNIGALFQEYTKYRAGPGGMRGGGRLRRTGPPATSRDSFQSPARYKVYRDVELIDLPPPETAGGPGIWEVLERRRSRREFGRQGIGADDLSRLLWATQGETGGYPDWPFRTVPSAGALYPIETYLWLRAVEGIAPGLYHYRISGHRLESLRRGNFGRDLTEACLGQGMLAAAACVFIWTAVIERSAWKYGPRAYRYIYLDAGHIGQNLHLAAEALGLGCCMIGALYDDEVNRLVGIDGREETVLYLGAVGRPQGR